MRMPIAIISLCLPFEPLRRSYPERRSGARSSRRLPEGAEAMIGTNRYIGTPVERIEVYDFCAVGAGSWAI
jgi:hypothetical protein